MRNTIQAILLLLFVSGCLAEKNSVGEVESMISGIKTYSAPDKRVALFDINAIYKNGAVLLKGESNLPEAVATLKDSLQAQGITYIDSISMLPDPQLEGKEYAVVNLSVANIRSEPQHSAELATQALLGTPLNVLKKERGWYLVQTPDKYISWIDWGGLQLMTREDLEIWKEKEKVIFTRPFGFLYDAPNPEAATKADLVMGNLMEVTDKESGYYKVAFPDGTPGYVKQSDARMYNEWLDQLSPTTDSLVHTSFAFKGLPYLWGGTSFKGVDCSGFTKTVYFMNGLIIPRDASQQIHTGILVDDKRNLTKLQPGDLLFFGRAATDSTSEKVVHVGIWIGNNEFIHASGNVHVSSMDSSAANFDEYNYTRYLRTKRLLHQDDEKLIPLKGSELF